MRRDGGQPGYEISSLTLAKLDKQGHEIINEIQSCSKTSLSFLIPGQKANLSSGVTPLFKNNASFLGV